MARDEAVQAVVIGSGFGGAVRPLRQAQAGIVAEDILTKKGVETSLV